MIKQGSAHVLHYLLFTKRAAAAESPVQRNLRANQSAYGPQNFPPGDAASPPSIDRRQPILQRPRLSPEAQHRMQQRQNPVLGGGGVPQQPQSRRGGVSNMIERGYRGYLRTFELPDNTGRSRGHIRRFELPSEPTTPARDMQELLRGVDPRILQAMSSTRKEDSHPALDRALPTRSRSEAHSENVLQDEDLKVSYDGGPRKIPQSVRRQMQRLEAAQRPPVTNASPRTRYTIQRGDTLSQIAQRKGIGDNPMDGARRIGRLNDLEDINKVRAGQEIYLD